VREDPTIWVDDWIAEVNAGGGSLDRFVASDARVIAPGGAVQGRAEYVELMGGLLASMGQGAEFRRVGEVRHHNGWMMFRWQVTGAASGWEGSTEGVDVVQINDSGQMVLNIVFPDIEQDRTG